MLPPQISQEKSPGPRTCVGAPRWTAGTQPHQVPSQPCLSSPRLNREKAPLRCVQETFSQSYDPLVPCPSRRPAVDHPPSATARSAGCRVPPLLQTRGARSRQYSGHGVGPRPGRGRGSRGAGGSPRHPAGLQGEDLGQRRGWNASLAPNLGLQGLCPIHREPDSRKRAAGQPKTREA